jgi:1-acyl-sn-glycerol-3-phosphate acyltransferase
MDALLDKLSFPRSVIVSLFFGFWTLLLASIVVLLAGVFRAPRKRLDFIIVNLWTRPMVRWSGVRVHVRGLEHVMSRAKGFLILFNHSSHMDIPILFSSIPRTFNFGAKIELFKIPFFGRAMELCGVLPIDRHNRSKVLKIYQDAISRVNQGESFALAPEGTRQPEPLLGRFKRGPFEFAVNAQMDIVPVVMAGVYHVMPKSTIWINAGRWRRDVYLEVLPPVSTEGLGPDEAESLQDRVREMMLESFTRQMKELEASSPKSLS